MTMDSQALNYIKTWLEPHAAAFADQMALELAGKGDAPLETACDTLRAEPGRQLPETMATGLAIGFAALVRDRLAATKH